MSSDIVIEAQDLGKCYPIFAAPLDRLKQMVMPRFQSAVGQQPRRYFREFWALKGVSFEVNRGETVGIIGRNGSGKSTLLQIVCGTLTPTIGQVTTQGRVAALLELGAGFNPDFTGRENAVLNAQLLGLSQQEIAEKIGEIESFAEIGEFFDRPVRMYSSGMYVRVAFAVQACVEPDVLIVDEALAVGDEKFQRKCFSYIESLRSRGTSILLVTHSATIIERFCQKALLMHQGQPHGFGRSNEMIDQYHALLYADEAAYLRTLNSNFTSSSTPDIPDRDVPIDLSESLVVPERQCEASILSCSVCDSNGEPSEFFRPRETAEIVICFFVQKDIDEVQVGINLRTVEGVAVFGTSTLYTNQNIRHLGAQDRVTVRFRVSLDLCDGTYFVSAAIARPVSDAQMIYLDKRSDAVVVKVADPRFRATGIANLPTEIIVNL